MPSSAGTVRAITARLQTRQQLEDVLDWLGSKIFPRAFPLILVHSDPGTRNINRQNGRRILGTVLENHPVAKLHKDT
jgi:hypothetical protein